MVAHRQIAGTHYGGQPTLENPSRGGGGGSGDMGRGFNEIFSKRGEEGRRPISGGRPSTLVGEHLPAYSFASVPFRSAHSPSSKC